MQITDQVFHPLVRYSAKDFDAQEGHRFTMLVSDDKPIETGVYIHWLGDKPVDVAVDISSMSGCTRKCTFCAAAKTRGEALDADQILLQVALAIERVRPSHKKFFEEVKRQGKLTFSFQGIGEPADATAAPEVTKAIAGLRHAYKDWNALQFSISSILDRVEALDDWRNLGLQTLQFSLHAPNDRKRNELLGERIRTPIKAIFEKLDQFYLQSPSSEIKVNYLLIADRNDSMTDCEELLQLLQTRPEYFLKISYLNDTYPARIRGLAASRRYREFLATCKNAHRKTYQYGSFQDLHISCGQLASYAEPERADNRIRTDIEALYDDIRSGQCTLFLGAGASYTAWDSRGLAETLYEELGRAVPFAQANLSLAEIADAFEHRHKRSEVDERIRAALRGAKVPSAMFDVPRYPWRAIYTTNYDEFVERAYAEAIAAGFADKHCHTVLRPEDLHGLATGAVPLIKLHGSVSEGLRTVLSDTDYLDGYVESVQVFLHRLAADRLEGSVLFIGYSFRDHFIKQWLFDLQHRLSRPQGRLWAVQPERESTSDDRERLDAQFGVTLIATDFSGLMRELEVLRRRPVLMASGSKKRAIRGGAERLGATDKIDTLCTLVARGLDDRGVRLITGATATDKVGYLIANKMSTQQLITTYTWRGSENVPGNDFAKMIRRREVGGRPSAVIDRLLREANMLLVVGGGALTLRETLAAIALGRPVIPVAIGGQFASDVIHSLLSRQYEAVEILSADIGLDAGFGEKVIEALTVERLAALRLDEFPAENVATTILEIVDHVAALESALFVNEAIEVLQS